MNKGLSIHVGLNRVDPNHYRDGKGKPWDGALVACEFDAQDMQALADACGFQSTLLLTEQATVQNVVHTITQAATRLHRGDLLFLSYSGHGGQVPDLNNEESEADDQMDETWCLYDRQLIDDELYTLWGKFEQGVRIIMLSDSCHSGTVSRGLQTSAILSNPAIAGDQVTAAPRFRVMSQEGASRTYRKNRKAYDKIQRSLPQGDRVAVGASVLLISGCQDGQLSQDGDRNGLFTATLLKVWKGGAFGGAYRTLHRNVRERMPLWQVPNFFATGQLDPNFEKSPAFRLG